MAYACIKNPCAECDGCGDCRSIEDDVDEDMEDEYEEV